jgi:hypothetical protein
MSNTWKQMLSLTSALLTAALVMFAVPQRAAADGDDPPGRVARLNYIHGSVSFQPGGEDEWVSAVANRPITTGDKLWVDKEARAELHIGSAAIRLGGNTGFSFLNLDDRTVQIRLTDGVLNIRLGRLDQDETFEVDTSNLAFSLLRAGEYRIETNEDGNSTIIAVRGGEGEVTGGGQASTIHSEQRGVFNGTDTLDVDVQSAGGYDDFDKWCRDRDRHEDHAQSAKYVSRDVTGYEDLDDHGTWRDVPEYGHVWVPATVVVGWAPYRFGHWVWISPWGWTWVDDAPWGFAPFHYGRWVFVGGFWGWVPGPVVVRPVYAPALVAWVGGPHFSLAVGVGGGVAGVAWFPLGPREVFVPAYRVSPTYVTNVNITNTTVNRTTITNVYNTTNVTNVTNVTQVNNVTYVNRNVPGAVTAVPQSTFANSQAVAKAAVPMDAKQLASAHVGTTNSVAPTRASVMGAGAANASVATPPAAIANRAVVAKNTPPPPPVSFAKQQQALAAHPGQPLSAAETSHVQAATTAAAHPYVKPATSAGAAATVAAGSGNKPNATGAGQAGSGKDVQPSVGGANKSVTPGGNAPANAAVHTSASAGADAPPSKPAVTRDDRPQSPQHGGASGAANLPGAASSGRPSDTGTNKPENSGGSVSAGSRSDKMNKPEKIHDDRPPSGEHSGASSTANVPSKPSNSSGNASPNAHDNAPANARGNASATTHGSDHIEKVHDDRPPASQKQLDRERRNQEKQDREQSKRQQKQAEKERKHDEKHKDK